MGEGYAGLSIDERIRGDVPKDEGTADWGADEVTSSTYTVQSSDNGKVIKVRVTFTDDAGNEETLTSAGTSEVVLGGL